MGDNWTGDTLNVRAGALGGTSMRYHELALQRWLNKVFVLRYGAAVPVVFTSPMDAFSLFSKLWSEANNPFQYLLELVDEKGTPLYQPYPAPVRYPVISVFRKNQKLRQSHNFSIHRMTCNWPTVSSTGSDIYGFHKQGSGLTLCNLGEVTTSRYPMAVDFRFQIDHFCNRPDTQAFFFSQIYREFWRTGGSQMQTWIKVDYPGMGSKLVRLYIDGDIDNLTPEEPEDSKNVEYRTSFTLVIEGYDVDLDYKIYPALWNVMMRFGSVPPESLDSAFDFTASVDMREKPENPNITYRQEVTDMPPAGTCAVSLRDVRLQEAQIHSLQFSTLVVTETGPTEPPGYPASAGAEIFGGGTISSA